MSLRAKFAAALSAFSVLLTLGLGWVMFADQKRALTLSLDGREQRQIVEFAALCRQAELSRNDLVLFNYLRMLIQDPAVAYAAFVDARGVARVHSDARFALRPWREFEASSPPAAVRRELAVPGSNGLLAVVGFSRTYRDSLYRAALAKLMRRAWQLSAIVIAVACFGSLWLATTITRALRACVDGAVAIGNGDFNRRIELHSRDELGALAQAFNVMAEKLAALDQLKDEFIATVSHDLRGPVGAMMMTAETLQQGLYGPLSGPQIECLAMLKISGSKLIAFVNNVLDAAKIKAGKMELNPEPVDVAEAAAEVVALFAPLAASKAVTLTADVAGQDGRAIADRQKLEQVLNNLVSNALKFTPRDGRITVEVRVDGKFVRIAVRDTGLGIAAEDLPKMFRKFQQIDLAKQRELKIVGTGLGLTICQSLIEAQGGRIWVESQKGVGSSFLFTLPRA